jgi:hypothetical protein
MMPWCRAGVIEAIRDQPMHALPEHVREIHWWAGFVAGFHLTTRRVAPSIEINGAMMTTLANMKMNLRLRRCRYIRSRSPVGSRIEILWSFRQ